MAFLLRTVTFFVITLLYAITMSARPNGLSGRSSMSSGGCGECHGNTTPDADVTVHLRDPVPITMRAGDRREFSIVVAHDSALVAGINIAFATSTNGFEKVGRVDATEESGLRVFNNELVHRFPHQMEDSADFTFGWTAPSQPGTYFIQAVAMAGNGDYRDGPLDRWAWMIPVAIIVTPATSVAERHELSLASEEQEEFGDLVSITVHSLDGAVVYTEIARSNQKPFSLPDWLPNSVYAVELQGRRRAIMRMMIKD